MEKLKKVTGTVHAANGKFFCVIDGSGRLHYVDYNKKHLQRFRNMEIKPGDIISLNVKLESLSSEVIDVVNFEYEIDDTPSLELVSSAS